ncbi:hypothetical protein [Kitasatospora aureofaciens]|uniref:hypothetical protein n=1 Tax=Kitasatospora aureofaciens TaxID=1894 RepID=UPI00340A3EDB
MIYRHPHTRFADDPAGAADLADLLTVLIRASHRRAAAAMLSERPQEGTGTTTILG